MTRDVPDANDVPWGERPADFSRGILPELMEANPTLGEDAMLKETETLLFALAQAVEQRDQHTARHCERLAATSVALGMALHLDRPSLSALYRGGYLHDIGKVGIPDAILFKPGPLSAEEWVIMRSHTVRGEDICRHVASLAPVLPIIRHHHERWDGSGYPDGLRDTQIPLLARVLQVADIYDALTSPRPYKRAYPPKQALRILERETERGWRDAEIVSLFLRMHRSVISRIDEYSIGGGAGLDSIRIALGSLGDALRSSNRAACPVNGHSFFPPPQSAPLTDSPAEAKDR